MNFNLHRWRRTYDDIKRLGNTLRDSRPTFDKFNNETPPVAPLKLEEQEKIEKKIQANLDKIKNYMDATGMNLRPGLWVYNRNDPTTWASHKSFKYGHLLRK